MKSDGPDVETYDLQIEVNGDSHLLRVAADETLAEALRERTGLRGVRIGCETGDCGACTVLMDEMSAKSCLVLAATVGDRKILTIEGVADAGGAALQEAFESHYAFQCGFCVPGMLLSGLEACREGKKLSEEEAADVVSGNLCRCTGYTRIVDAIVAGS